MIDIVKRKGKRPTEAFQHQKLHNSLYAACLSVKTPEGEAKRIADTVIKAVVDWAEARSEVTSDDIRRVAARSLAVFHDEAAYLYQHHRQIL